MQGLSMSSIKKHPALIPLYVCFFAGVIGSGGYLLRLAIKSPEVTWLPRKNTEPWNDYTQKDYKMYSTTEYQEQLNTSRPSF